MAFGAAAPGRRVLYSASRVLHSPPEGCERAYFRLGVHQCQPIVHGCFASAANPRGWVEGTPDRPSEIGLKR